ncbi:MAG: hypothetical protein CK425_05125 [Parachlamydia sp.]|nr:MAG: hypothetical protein CK425_05125 [Parachlamydia sp.]
MKINWINFEFNLGQSLSEPKKTNPLDAVIGKIMHGCFSRNRDKIPEYVCSRSLGENKKWKTIKEFFKKILRKIVSVFKRTPKVPKTNPSAHKANAKPAHIPAPPPPPPLFSKPSVPASVKNMHEELRKRVPETQPNTASSANPSARQRSIPTKTVPTPVPTTLNSTPGQTKSAPTTGKKAAPAAAQSKPDPVPAQTKSTSTADTTRPNQPAASQTTMVPPTTQSKQAPTSKQHGPTSAAEATRPAPTTQKTTAPSAAHPKPAPTTAKTMPAAQKIFQDKINNPPTAQATGNPGEGKRQNSKLAAQWEKNVAAQAAATSSPPKEKIQVAKKDPHFLAALAAKVAKGGSTPEKKGSEVGVAVSTTAVPSATTNFDSKENTASAPLQTEASAAVTKKQPPMQPVKASSPQASTVLTPHTPESGPDGKRKSTISAKWQQSVATPSSSEKPPVTTPSKINPALMGKIAGINFSPKGKPATTPPKQPRKLDFEGVEEAPPTAEELEKMMSSCPEADFLALEKEEPMPAAKDDSSVNYQNYLDNYISPSKLGHLNKARPASIAGQRKPTHKTLKSRKQKKESVGGVTNEFAKKVPDNELENKESPHHSAEEVEGEASPLTSQESNEPSSVKFNEKSAEKEGSLKGLDSDGEKSSSEDDFVHVGSSPELSPTTTPRDDQKQEN